MISKFISFVLSVKYYILAVIILVIAGFYFFGNGNNGDGQYVHLAQGPLITEVSVAGTVVASKTVDLSFETGGTVDAVYKDVGETVNKDDVIVSLNTSEIKANLAQAEANLEVEQVKLAQLQSGSGNTTEITTAKRKLADSVVDGFSIADDAIRNKVDQFFTDARTANPKILFAFNDYDLKEEINKERILVEEALTKWSLLDATVSYSNISDTDADQVRGYLTVIKTFLNNVSQAVNDFRANETLSQTSIDKYKGDVATARININNAFSSLTTSQEAARLTFSDEPVQQAKVKSVQATVDLYKAQLSKALIRSPFSGVVSAQEAKVGEAVSAHNNLVSLISSSFEIEAYVPELNITGVQIGDKASVTLDAFGLTRIWNATVVQVNPAQTIKDGVATYKVRFVFDNADANIRPGMTANIKIETSRKENVWYLPLRAIVEKDAKKYVSLHTTEAPVLREVVTGDKDTKGNVEIISGITAEDQVFLNPQP